MRRIQLTQRGKYHYKFLILLSILYAFTFILANIGVHKPTTIGPFHIIASSLIYPFAFVISDIIAEVYGYKVSRQVVWSIIPATVFYQFFLSIIIHIPADPNWQGQAAYNYVSRATNIIDILGVIGAMIGFLMNSYLITRLKVFYRGRHFIFRSISSSAIGELIQLLFILVGILLAGNMCELTMYPLLFHILLFRLIIIGLAAPYC